MVAPMLRARLRPVWLDPEIERHAGSGCMTVFTSLPQKPGAGNLGFTVFSDGSLDLA
jgi:hypothetical protein